MSPFLDGRYVYPHIVNVIDMQGYGGLQFDSGYSVKYMSIGTTEGIGRIREMELKKDIEEWWNMQSPETKWSIDDIRRMFLHLTQYHKYPIAELKVAYCSYCHGLGYVNSPGGK